MLKFSFINFMQAQDFLDDILFLAKDRIKSFSLEGNISGACDLHLIFKEAEICQA